jgi:predicted RNase H-like HicB family nuclease
MNPKYSYRIAWSDDDACWFAISPEFGTRVSAYGDTPQEAMTELDTVLESVIDIYRNEGWQLPEPVRVDKIGFTMPQPNAYQRELIQAMEKSN